LQFLEETLNKLALYFHAMVSRRRALREEHSVLFGDKDPSKIWNNLAVDVAMQELLVSQETLGNSLEYFGHCLLRSSSSSDMPASSDTAEGTLSNISMSLPHPACRPGACVPLLEEKSVSLEARSAALEKEMEQFLYSGTRVLDMWAARFSAMPASDGNT
jgi:hypothetical protein